MFYNKGMNENLGHAAYGNSGEQASSEYLVVVFWKNRFRGLLVSGEDDSRWETLGEDERRWEIWPARRRFGSEAELELFLAAQGLERSDRLALGFDLESWWLRRAGALP